MILTIHQPNYFPYPGLFHKLALSDVFVIMDDVQFQLDITNRNKIISKNEEWERITVPIKKNQTHKNIMDVEINNDLPWGDYTFKKISEAYTTLGDENKRNSYNNKQNSPFSGGFSHDAMGDMFKDMFKIISVIIFYLSLLYLGALR